MTVVQAELYIPRTVIVSRYGSYTQCINYVYNFSLLLEALVSSVPSIFYYIVLTPPKYITKTPIAIQTVYILVLQTISHHISCTLKTAPLNL